MFDVFCQKSFCKMFVAEPGDKASISASTHPWPCKSSYTPNSSLVVKGDGHHPLIDDLVVDLSIARSETQ